MILKICTGTLLKKLLAPLSTLLKILDALFDSFLKKIGIYCI